MVLTNGSKKARYASSVTSRTSVFGSMPGSAPAIGRGTNTSVAYKHSGLGCAGKCVPTGTPAQQYASLLSRGLIFNCKMTGGVGRHVFSSHCRSGPL